MYSSRKTLTFAVSLVGMLLVGAATARPAAADPDVKADNVAYASPNAQGNLKIEAHLHKDGTVDGKLTLVVFGPLASFPGKYEVDINDMVIGAQTPAGSRATVSGIVKSVDSPIAASQAFVGKTLILTVFDTDDKNKSTDDKSHYVTDLPDRISTLQIDLTNTKNAHTEFPTQVTTFFAADGDIRVNQD